MHINQVQQLLSSKINHSITIGAQKDKFKEELEPASNPIHPINKISATNYRAIALAKVSFVGECTEPLPLGYEQPIKTALSFPTVSDYKGYTLDKYQQEAVTNLIAGNDVIVSAPTGTGKTLIAEEIILENLRKDVLINNLKKGKQTFYTAPLKAVVDAKFADFQKEFGIENVARLTGDYKTENALSHPIVVMTTEVYRNMMLSRKAKGESSRHPASTVVFDELHYMGDLQRGSVWEEAIMLSPPNTQILGLSATISNDQKLVDWIKNIHTAEGKKAVLVSVPRENRHVPLHYFAYDPATPGTIHELEESGVSSEILQNSNVSTNFNLTPAQRKGIERLDVLYDQNKVIQGFKSINRIRSNYAPTMAADFAAALKTVSAKFGVTIPPEKIQLITSELVDDNKSVLNPSEIAVREYDFVPFDSNKLSDIQKIALENLSEIGESYKVEKALHKEILPAATTLIENTIGVNNQQVNYDSTVNFLVEKLKALGFPDAEKIAREAAEPFKVKKPSPLIDFIQAITLKKEMIFSDPHAESIIQRRLELAYKKQGFNEVDQKSKALADVEKLRNAFCSFYDNPEINTISKAMNYSDSQYVTKHLINVPTQKFIDTKKIAELKARFTTEEIKIISLFGFISNRKKLMDIKEISDIEKLSYNDENFIKGARLISSYSSQKIKTKENFIYQVIAPKFISMQKRLKSLATEMKDLAGSDSSKLKTAQELLRYSEDLNATHINILSNAVLRAMLEKNPKGVIKVKEVLTQLVEDEKAKQKLDNSPESFMFKLPKKQRFDENQYKQLNKIGEFLKYKKSDRGVYIKNKLNNYTHLNTVEKLKAELSEKMQKHNVEDIETKIEQIVTALTRPLSEDEIAQAKTEKIKEMAIGKVKLKVVDLLKATNSQSEALTELAPLYSHLDSEKKFIPKSTNNGIIRLFGDISANISPEEFRTRLSSILSKLLVSDAEREAGAITNLLTSKVLHKDLSADVSKTASYRMNGFSYIPDLVNTLQKDKKLPAIFFIFSRKQCESSLKECTKETSSDLLSTKEKIRAEAIIEKYLKAGEIIDPNFAAQKDLLLRGYAVHHAGRMPAYKNLVQELSENGLIKVTFATETLAAGINFPTRTTVITKLLKPESDNSGNIYSRNLKASEFQQMAGRAGRRGYDKEGFTIVIGNESASFKKALDLAEKAPESVESHYKPSYGLIANLLMNNPSVQDLDQHFAKSFLIEEHSDITNKDKIRTELQSRTNDILEIMLKKGYIEKVDNYGKFKVTAKGQIASLVKGVNEILFTDLLTDPKLLNLNELDSSMFAGIISSISYDSSDIHKKLRTKSAQIIKDEYTTTASAMRDVLDMNITSKIEEIIETEKVIQAKNMIINDSTNPSLKRTFVSFNKWMAPFIYQWSRFSDMENINDFWNELTEKMQKGGLLKDQADFTRNLRNTLDLLQQVENITDYIDTKDLYTELKADPVRISHIKALAQKAQVEMSKLITTTVKHAKI